MLRLVLLGENLDSDLGWLDPVMAALEHRSLPEDIVDVEETSSSAWCHQMIGANMNIVDRESVRFGIYFSSPSCSFGLI